MGTYEYLVESTASPTLPERMQELYAAGELMDTTLVCKNGSVRAHKVVMAAQSKFLEDVLVQHPCKSPVIVLLDVDIDTLRCLVDYMYHGKVAIKASIFDDFVKAANVLRLVSIIRGPEGHDEDDETTAEIGGHMVACERNDASSFEGAVCHVEEMNNFVDPTDTSTSPTTNASATAADAQTTTANTTQLETAEVISEGQEQELVQVQSLEGHMAEDSFVTEDLSVAIGSPATRPTVTSSNATNQHLPSGLRTIVISSRASFDQRTTQRLFSQRPVERILCRTNQSKRRRFDVVALRSRPPPPTATVATSAAGGELPPTTTEFGKILAIPGTGPPAPPPPPPPLGGADAACLAGGGATKIAQGASAYNNRKCESLARIEAGLIRAEQRDGGESNLDELVNVHQQMVVDNNGVRMHQCLLCPQTTAFPSNMKRHIMGHLGIKPFKCQHCDFQSTLRGDLNVHMRKKHPNEETQQSMIISMK